MRPTRVIHRVAGVDIWSIDLDTDDRALDAALRVLSPQERRRAQRLRAGAARRRFVTRHGALRAILARYSGVEPARVSYRAGPGGKPVVEGGPFFSLSHSAALALCAVTADREVGVDVERLTTVSGADAIVERVFSAEEGRTYRSELAAEGTPGSTFLRLWTRKEALLKAQGVGFAEGSAVRRAPDPERWEIHDVDWINDYLAAVAVARHGVG